MKNFTNSVFKIFRALLIIISLINPFRLKSQNFNPYISTSFSFGKNNFDKFPVKYGSGNYPFSDKINTLEFEFGYSIGKNKLGYMYQWMYTSKDPIQSHNYGTYTGDAFQMKYSRVILEKNKIHFSPYLGIGIQSGIFIYTNDTNHLTSSITAGQSNEISLLTANPKITLGLKFDYCIQKHNYISIFIETSNGINPGQIKTTSNSVVRGYKFNPVYHQLGISYSISRR